MSIADILLGPGKTLSHRGCEVYIWRGVRENKQNIVVIKTWLRERLSSDKWNEKRKVG